MSDRFRYLVVHLRLCIETHGDGIFIFHEQAVMCYYLRIFILVDYVVHHTLEVASFCDFRHHIPILVRSS